MVPIFVRRGFVVILVKLASKYPFCLNKADSMEHRITAIEAKAREVWINVFWKNPNQLWALKVTCTIVVLVIPSLLVFEDTFIGTTMALGVVAMALGETDVHPKGRAKSAGIALLLFFITSSAVQLLFP